MNTQKTCYQMLVEAIVANPNVEPKYADFPEFAERGHSAEEFANWVETAQMVLSELSNNDGNVNKTKAECREQYLKELMKVPFYRLTTSEIETIKDSEWYGCGKNDSLIFTYDDKDVESFAHKYLYCNEGGRKDILVVFSGHPRTGIWAAETVFAYVDRYQKLPDGVIFLGLHDNQGMTHFSNGYKFRRGSEARMYQRQMLAQGLPKSWLNKFLMEPSDTSTEENAELLVETCRKYGLDKEGINLICVTYPAYQLRVATELSFALKDKLPKAWIRIAHVTPCMEELGEKRYFSYEKPEGQLPDLTFANCVAHLFREWGVKRFHPRCLEDEYPEEYKPLAPLFLAYSYPNVVNELCGTDMTVAAVLKVIRTLMLDAYDEDVDDKRWDEKMQEDTCAANLSRMLSRQVVPTVVFHGAYMTEQEFLRHYRYKF